MRSAGSERGLSAITAVMVVGAVAWLSACDGTISGELDQISAGAWHTCGVESDGDVRCWGAGESLADDDITSAGQADPPIESFEEIASGKRHTCGRKLAGDVECWGEGYDDYGDEGSLPDLRQISAGDGLTCGIGADDADVICWGADYNRRSIDIFGDARDISVGEDHVCVIMEEGAIECSGPGNAAQPPFGDYRDVSAGSDHTCAIDRRGSIVCWGSGSRGELNQPSGDFVSISSGRNHTCAITDADRVRCWGANDRGQSDAPSGRFEEVSAGGAHTCAIDFEGDVTCWGSNEYGQSRIP